MQPKGLVYWLFDCLLQLRISLHFSNHQKNFRLEVTYASNYHPLNVKGTTAKAGLKTEAPGRIAGLRSTTAASPSRASTGEPEGSS